MGRVGVADPFLASNKVLRYAIVGLWRGWLTLGSQQFGDPGLHGGPVLGIRGQGTVKLAP
jgi:hypothetical protein